MKIVATIEARMGSSRLPGKVLMPINGVPAIKKMIDRVKESRMIDDIIIATSANKLDNEIVLWAKEHNIKVFRGSEDDVLDRVVKACASVNGDIIVELTGDSILTDPEIIDLGVETFLNNDCDIVSNCGTYLTYPMGIYVQVFRYTDLKIISDTITDPAVREHVSLYFYENTDKYKLINLVAPSAINRPDIRTQLDYIEDHKFIEQIFSNLEPEYGKIFGVYEIIRLIERKPEILNINKHCIEKDPRG